VADVRNKGNRGAQAQYKAGPHAVKQGADDYGEIVETAVQFVKEKLVSRGYPMECADGYNGANEQGEVDSFIFQRGIPLACV